MTSQYRTRIAVVLLVTLLVGCGTPDTATQTIPTLPTTPTTVATSNSADDSLVTDTRNNATDLPPVAYTASYEVTRSLDVAVAQAELVVVGRFVGVGNVFNSARDNRDSSKVASDVFDVSQEYHFQVSQYLKGDGLKVLMIAQVEGAIRGDTVKVTPADIKRAKESMGVPLFEIGTQYLLLLQKDIGIDNTLRYSGSEPWRFVVGEDGISSVSVPGDVRMSLPEDFIPQPDAPLIPQIEQIVRQQATAP